VRLRWESQAPAATARWLASVLDLPLESPDDDARLDLGGAILELGEPADGGSTDERLRVIDTEPTPAASPPRPIGFTALGFATVDTERAATERGWRLRPAEPDRILGADANFVIDPERVLLLEPHTEGRVAASLARWGEGPAALYLAAASGIEGARDASRARGGRVTTISSGPFGREFVILGPRIWGPHIVLVESDAMPPGAGTIDR
jgi:hypothetical protein